MSSDLEVHLSHDIPDTKRRTVFLRARQESDPPQHTGESISLKTTIHNGRDASLKLDEASFELVQHPTSLATDDFYNSPEMIRSQYYEEMKALFTKMTGSPHVKVFHHQVRNKDKVNAEMTGKDGSINTSTPVQPYAHGIHSDSSPFHAEQMFKQMVGTMPESCRRGRFLYINAWRNISEDPIENNHLAVLDERTLVKPDDYIQTDLYGVGYEVMQYHLSVRNAHQHKWYYFPRMAKDEVLLFKQWDSDSSRLGRLCFHTAINDATAPADAASRQSIETRAFVFFPEHQPNTCPLMPIAKSGVPGQCDEFRAKEGAHKIIGGLSYIEASAGTRAMVINFMRTMYDNGGARSVLLEFSEDKQGHFGLTDASTETKARAVDLVIEGGGAKRVDALFAGPSATRILLGKLCENRAIVFALGAASSLFLSTAIRRLR